MAANKEYIIPGTCRYCGHGTDEDPFQVVFFCKQCKGWVHSDCIKEVLPTTVIYDNYFEFTCKRCSITGKEVFKRMKLSTLLITYLTIQNLTVTSFNSSNEGYFKFHEDIMRFIIKHWKEFYGTKKPTDDEAQKVCEKVRNILSASGFFQNGKAIVKQKGWWCLTSMDRMPSYNPYKAPFIVMVRGKKTGHIYQGRHRSSRGGQGPRPEELWVPKESDPVADSFDNDIEMILGSQPDMLKNSRWSKCLRELHGLPPTGESSEFDLFNEMEEMLKEKDDTSNQTEDESDRVEAPEDVALFYGKAKLIGSDKVQLIESHSYLRDDDYFSINNLKPFIQRTRHYKPQMYQLLQQIRERDTKLPDEMKAPKESLHPIDFCYFGPRHLEAVNYLCGQFFWPGIDLLPNLNHPQLSVVAMYKKLVVGFAIMEPDEERAVNYISYLFVRPEWRGSTRADSDLTISNFMLYHLVKKSEGKPIRLHVSITNKAAYSLYKQFGFTVLSTEHNYYKPNNFFNKTSPHAFYMECKIQKEETS